MLCQLSLGAFLVQCGNGGDDSKNEETIKNRIHRECEGHGLSIPVQSVKEDA